jgi:Tol biopolymer transport system component
VALQAAPAPAAATDPLAPWRDVSIKPVSEVPGRHTIHTYYLTSPESPDGKRVLFYASKTRDSHQGELIVRDRATGKETVIARDLETEDAHRAACQQWVSGGRRVAYHKVKDGRWSVHAFDLDTMQDRKLAEGRQLGHGRTVDDLVPIYGPHWNPGAHRGLEMLNVVTGEIRTVLPIERLEQFHGGWIKKKFGGRPASLFFPVMSPDGQKVLFKMAAPGPDGPANKFRSSKASERGGLLVYDLKAQEPLFTRLFMAESWGHPAWHPDSKRIIDWEDVTMPAYFDANDGGRVYHLRLPNITANHPSISPDGRLVLMDGNLTHVGGPAGNWGVAVCDPRTGQYEIFKRFDNKRGADSWRKSHPHPHFSADGKRIYFNLSEGEWTQLYMIEARSSAPSS